MTVPGYERDHEAVADARGDGQLGPSAGPSHHLQLTVLVLHRESAVTVRTTEAHLGALAERAGCGVVGVRERVTVSGPGSQPGLCVRQIPGQPVELGGAELSCFHHSTSTSKTTKVT